MSGTGQRPDIHRAKVSSWFVRMDNEKEELVDHVGVVLMSSQFASELGFSLTRHEVVRLHLVFPMYSKLRNGTLSSHPPPPPARSLFVTMGKLVRWRNERKVTVQGL